MQILSIFSPKSPHLRIHQFFKWFSIFPLHSSSWKWPAGCLLFDGVDRRSQAWPLQGHLYNFSSLSGWRGTQITPVLPTDSRAKDHCGEAVGQSWHAWKERLQWRCHWTAFNGWESLFTAIPEYLSIDAIQYNLSIVALPKPKGTAYILAGTKLVQYMYLLAKWWASSHMPAVLYMSMAWRNMYGRLSLPCL